ncbi:glycosyltransferase family 2 protein [Alloyangia pacifica]|uniref:Glycosyl transferase family 2 n=1 Tax=Alloyangia pacifica TaxID=311180 RepID=A0A1I6TMA3_9RHOB|nr:glycosyltransferase family 2 protein [Alloyangia pacifica]SDH14109.1 Glycosyl transferase family 2 [Alloyangia pacifica]SFS90117.1 Glycosyl transferase family 2 [Alloyangia pacifica]
MPRASIIVTVGTTADRLQDSLRSLCAQSFPDFEIIVVIDGSVDGCSEVAEGFGDLRIRVLRQRARGIPGARNTGIAAARGSIIGFCDAGDLWAANKLAAHVEHLQSSSTIGLSYSGFEMVTAKGARTNMWKLPRRRAIGAAAIFKRNPIGPASSAVFRRAALDSIAFRPPQETERDWWFDETFRQVETLELWLRLALVTDWEIAGIPRRLCTCRSSSADPAASMGKQLAAWERMVAKLSAQDRHFFARHASVARAYHLRHLARCAIAVGDAPGSARLLRAALACSLRPIIEEPRKTLAICASSLLLTAARTPLYDRLAGQRGKSA